MTRPKLEDLQRFASMYFLCRCPAVRWERMKPRGRADRKNNVILLNPDIPLKERERICVGICNEYEPVGQIPLDEGEQYFRVLLHEIGHFKIRLEPPKEYKALARRLKREYPDNLDEQVENSSYYIDKKPGESPERYYGRHLDFESWLRGDRITEHVEVADWAWEEFKRQRKRIRGMLDLPEKEGGTQ